MSEQSETVVVGTCKCGGYGIVLNELAEKEKGRCHLPLGRNEWEVSTYSDVAGCVIYDQAGDEVCVVRGDSERATKRAEQIVREHNSHEALVEALDGLLWNIDHLYEAWREPDEPNGASAYKEWEAAEEAALDTLAKAKGGAAMSRPLTQYPGEQGQQ